VKPGDRLVFGGDTQALPPDCTRRAIASWTVDPSTNTATWADPDATSVDARITIRADAVCTMTPFPFYRCETDVELDTGTSTSVADAARLTSIEVIECPDERYDQIRTAVASDFTPH